MFVQIFIDGEKLMMHPLAKYEKKLKGEKCTFRLTKLDEKIEMAYEIIKSCEFCEWKCKVDRSAGKLGFCGVGKETRVATAFAHYGEESMLVPSGTIFFCGCNSRCVFCQNWDISQFPRSGEVWSARRIADWINGMARTGQIINVNFVGGEPTPNLHTILESMQYVTENIPMVWNSNFYMSEKAMQLLDGVIDVYLSDFKYWSDECARKYSSLKNYQKIVCRNHLIAVENGEILIRHLVLPNHVECCSKPIIDWIAENLNEKVLVNLMSQYRPDYRAREFPEINRRITAEEYREVVNYAKKRLKYFLVQG